MAKFKKGDPVLVFKCPQFFAGGCGLIVNVSEETGEALYDVRDVADDERFMWVQEKFLMKLMFDKPTFWQKLKWFFGRI